jgi:hypothetical protein
MMPHELTVIVDGEEIAPAYRDVPEAGERFASATFTLSPDQLLRLSGARSVGARMMVPGAGVFFGFEMDVPDTKLRDTILGCTNVAQSPRSAPAEPTMSMLPGADLAGGDMLPMGLRDFSFDECLEFCRGERACRAVTWVAEQRWCWPKDRLAHPQPANGMISAYKP